jgi:hypothetical protein
MRKGYTELMTIFPGSPPLTRGALVTINLADTTQQDVVLFQYNPDSMTRRIDARSTGNADGGDRSEAFRLIGPPRETITLNVEFDATDHPTDVPADVYATLSFLELLLYPKSQTVISNTILAQLGNIEIIPPEAPLTVLVWGQQRVLPVRLTGFSITEEAHDALLNPIRAKVDLSLYVLSYFDLKITNPGYSLFLAHQIGKEALAKNNDTTGVRNIRVPFPLTF